jgi:hypothetical protein
MSTRALAHKNAAASSAMAEECKVMLNQSRLGTALAAKRKIGERSY